MPASGSDECGSRLGDDYRTALAEERQDFAQGVVGVVQVAEAHSLPLGL
jgi:hypothetical protein